METIQRLVRSLKSARSYNLPTDNKAAYYVLLSNIMQNQHRVVVEMLENNSTFDINFGHGKSKRTLLHMAANVGAYECLVCLLKKGAVSNASDRQGITPLQVAARNGYVKCIVKLLEFGADLELKNNEGMTAVHWLAANGRTEVLLEISKLIDNIDVEDDRGQAPLHVACLNGHFHTVVSLLSLNATIDKVDSMGHTPLHTACSHGHANVVKELLQRGALLKYNNEMESPFISALKGGYGKVCVELMGKYPNMMFDMIDSSILHDIDLDKICDALLCVVGENLMWRNTLLLKISQQVSVEGLKLLSQSSDCEQKTKHFMQMLNLFNNLSSYLPDIKASSSISARSRINSRAGAKQKYDYNQVPINISEVNCEILRVWGVLESWMNILQQEMQCNVDPTEDVLKRDRSTHLHQQPISHSLSFSQLVLNQPAIEYNMQLSQMNYNADEIRLLENSNEPPLNRDVVVSPHAEGTSCLAETSASMQQQPMLTEQENASTVTEHMVKGAVKEFSNVIFNKNEQGIDNLDSKQDVVNLTGDRLCAVIHGYYLFSQTNYSWDKRCSNKRKIRFNGFIEKHKDVLLLLVSRNSQLIFDHFGFVLDNPVFLQYFLPAIHSYPFTEREQWFYKHLRKNKTTFNMFDEQTTLNIVRESLLESSCQQLIERNGDQLKENINVRFAGEEGMGAGVTREWLDLLVKDMLNPDCALFTLSSDGSTFQPNGNSSINPDHLSFFQFAGRVMGLALYHKHLITAYFTRSFYKHILGVPVNYIDVESIDPEYSKNLQWILDNDISTLGLDITFSCETDVFGQMQEVELKPNGKNILVTEENKLEYVHLAADLRMTKAIKPQIMSFLTGFYQFIPHSMVSLFNEYELELLLSGLPNIDVDDWMTNTIYQAGYDQDSLCIKWFWEVVRDFSKEEQVQLLQFVTGTSRVPWGGFSNLAGAVGVQQFTISRSDGKSLPTSSTCFNMIKLPEYKTRDELSTNLKVAITCGCVGFEFT